MSTMTRWFRVGLLALPLAVVSLSACGDDQKSDPKTNEQKEEGEENDIEAPASCAILKPLIGTYTVTGAPTDNEHRGTSTAEHERGSVILSQNLALDFDTNLAFTGEEIVTCYDRTQQDFDRRIQVSYDADDSGRVLNFYLDESLQLQEVQYRHANEGVNVRVAVEAN